MTHQVKFVLRHRNGEVHSGKASDYPANAGWQDVAGVPACYRYGCQMNYAPARAERYALLAIANQVIVGEDAPAIVKRNADLFWNQLEREYDELGVHPTYRRQRAN